MARTILTNTEGGIMQTPVQVTFRRVDPSPAVEMRVRELAERLYHYCGHITGCHVVIQGPPAHRHKGAPYSVRIDVIVPGQELAVDSERDLHHEHGDIYVALRDAFDAMRRQLEDYVRRRRGDTKHHEATNRTGVIAEIDANAGFGRIDSDDGHLIYFHSRSVHDTQFESLAVGTRVKFEDEPGDAGPQAIAVRVQRLPM
jgi:cold shock CspA family protein